jgi:carbamoyltransferase
MNKKNLTLAVYGIQDIDDKEFPVMVHDHNICLFADGQIKKYLQLERFSRKKYDNQMPAFLEKLLKKEKLAGIENIDLVFVDNVIGSSFINKRGNIRFEAPLCDSLAEGLKEGKGYWFGKEVSTYLCNHELAHIYSCLPFYGMFKNNSLLIHFDGGASLSNFSAWYYANGVLKRLEYHWKLNYLSSFFNSNALTFSIIGTSLKDQNSLPGKLMGFSSYGRYREELEKWLKENEYFENIWKQKQDFFDKVKEDYGIELKHFDQRHPFVQDIAATIQYIFERDFINYIKEINKDVQADYLYYTGGSALNIKCNASLVNEHLFREVFIPPCTNDSGLSIGAGALLEWRKHREIKFHSPYLNNWGLKESFNKNFENSVRLAASEIIKGKVGAIYNEFGEVGPRALGNRSIIARPDNKILAQQVSCELKGREWYRPLAPVMLAENLPSFTGKKEEGSLSHYMLTEFEILPQKQKEIEGVVHVDGTSRIQKITKKEQNPFLYELLKFLDHEYGLKALINTSFNAKGKPIVHSPEDARNEASQMGLDFLVLNGDFSFPQEYSEK